MDGVTTLTLNLFHRSQFFLFLFIVVSKYLIFFHVSFGFRVLQVLNERYIRVFQKYFSRHDEPIETMTLCLRLCVPWPLSIIEKLILGPHGPGHYWESRKDNIKIYRVFIYKNPKHAITVMLWPRNSSIEKSLAFHFIGHKNTYATQGKLHCTTSEHLFLE